MFLSRLSDLSKISKTFFCFHCKLGLVLKIEKEGASLALFSTYYVYFGGDVLMFKLDHFDKDIGTVQMQFGACLATIG